VVLAVTDSGVGMDEAVRQRIFEPFFTTKSTGKGTGLGLATVYGIVRQSDGYIFVYSERGHGTTFKVYLPCTNDAAIRPTEAPAPHQLRGSEAVLLVEDDAAVRTAMRRTLETHGYSVWETSTGREALSELERGLKVDLVLSDVVMPDLGGRVLAQRLTEISPCVPVLLVSGFSDEAVVRHGMLEPGAHFLTKPFGATALLRKIREILDAPRGEP
jgi:two-component system cell cycle sensor histidine kinase/response regulator CckA